MEEKDKEWSKVFIIITFISGLIILSIIFIVYTYALLPQELKNPSSRNHLIWRGY